MNNKVTLPRLVTRIASSSGRSKKQVEDFLKTLFSTVGEALTTGESVKIKGLGTFKILIVEARKSVNVSTGEDHQIPAHKKIVFIPDKELAAKVNAPFEMFDTVEVSDDILEEDFNAIDKEAGLSSNLSDLSDRPDQTDILLTTDVRQSGLESEIVTSVLNESSEPDFREDVSSESVSLEAEETTVSEIVSDNADKIEESIDKKEDVIECYAMNHHSSHKKRKSKHHRRHRNSVSDGHYDDSHRHGKSKSRFGKGFVLGFCSAMVLMLIGFGITWFVFNKRIDQIQTYTKDSVSGEAVLIETSDTVETGAQNTELNEVNESKKAEETADANGSKSIMPETKASDVVIDTITLSRYLTTMARDHYGNYHLWAYIYKENEGKLGDPDRIRPGTTVVIPDLRKYGVDPKNKEDIRKARNLGQQIYKRYNK